MSSTSTFRIPRAPLTGLHGAAMRLAAKTMFNGQVPDVAYVTLHHKPVLRASSLFGLALQRWRVVDADLKSYAMLTAAASIGCSWCIDFGYYRSQNEGVDEAKLREVLRWRESDVFNPLERDVLAYAEAMTETPPTVTDELVARLHEALGSAGVVELTQVIAFENMVSRFNASLGLASQGLSTSCAVAYQPEPTSQRE